MTPATTANHGDLTDRSADSADGRAAGQPRIVVIGTGFSGIGMAIRLLQDGFTDVTLLERAGAVGGTWRDNHYPGAACDIPSHLYSLSFAPKADWTRVYPRQAEIWDHLTHVADDRGVTARTHFDTEVASAEFDDATATWTVTSTDGRAFTADVLVGAIGGLKDPAYPDIPGREDFAGPQLHSARWDHDVDFTGKRVAVVGTGASAIQFAPEIAPLAGQLTVFQRSAPWVVPRHDRAYTRLERWAIRRIPGMRRLVRAAQYWRKEVRYPLFFRQDWPLVRIAEQRVKQSIRSHIDDPDLREKVTPDYRLGCKRVLISNDWYPTLNLDHVDVETTALARFTPTGAVLADGREVDFDVVVFGTGFRVSEPLGEAVIRGRDGLDLSDFWDGRPTAHNTVTVPGFPNLFLLTGPNSALGHNSQIVMIEASIEYTRQAVHHLADHPEVAWVDVRRDAHDEFVAELDRRHEGQAWAGGCTSWYLNDRGENFTVWPGSTVDFRRRLRHFDLAAHHHEPVDHLAGHRTPARHRASETRQVAT